MLSNPNRTRMIWITPKFPLGNPDGARHATRALIEELTQMGVAIDLVCLLPEGESADSANAQQSLGVTSCTLIRRSGKKYWPLPAVWTPFTFRTFVTSGVRKSLKRELARLLMAEAPVTKTWIVFDGLHTFGALSHKDLQDLSPQCDGIIYRAHNVETVLWEQCAEQARTPWQRWFFNYQAALVRIFERRIAASVSLIAPVSEDDAVKFRSLAPGSDITVTPIGITFPAEKTVQAVKDADVFELLFVGRLDWLPNRSGLLWFLEKVWPRLVAKRPRVSLKIAGVGDGRWLEAFRHLQGIQLLGKVDDIKPLYEACALSIAPLFQGSGTRVKILEAARFKRVVLTTAQGAEGIGLAPGESYYRAETQGEWLTFLQTVTTAHCRLSGIKAFEAARERFDGRAIATMFLNKVLRQSGTGASTMVVLNADPIETPVQAGGR